MGPLTNFDFWKQNARTATPEWSGRAESIAALIPEHASVLDIGAGDQKLKNFLPKGCAYQPIDCVDERPGTFVVDFNKETKFPEGLYDVIVCAGFLEYINDIDAFFEALEKRYSRSTIIFTYLFRKYWRPHKHPYAKYVTRRRFARIISRHLCRLEQFNSEGRTNYYIGILGKPTGQTERNWVGDLASKIKALGLATVGSTGRSDK